MLCSVPINPITTASLGSSSAYVTCSRMGSPGAGAEMESGTKMKGKWGKQDQTEREIQLMKPGLASSLGSFGESPPVSLVLLSAPRDRPLYPPCSVTGCWPAQPGRDLRLSGSVADTDPGELMADMMPLPQQPLLYREPNPFPYSLSITLCSDGLHTVEIS